MYVTQLLLISKYPGDQECIFFTLNTYQVTFNSDILLINCRKWSKFSDTRTDGRTHARTDERTDGRTDERKDGRTDGCMEEGQTDVEVEIVI